MRDLRFHDRVLVGGSSQPQKGVSHKPRLYPKKRRGFTPAVFFGIFCASR